MRRHIPLLLDFLTDLEFATRTSIYIYIYIYIHTYIGRERERETTHILSTCEMAAEHLRHKHRQYYEKIHTFRQPDMLSRLTASPAAPKSASIEFNWPDCTA